MKFLFCDVFQTFNPVSHIPTFKRQITQLIQDGADPLTQPNVVKLKFIYNTEAV